ncbi:MAG: C1 family peptidase [Candidatus Thiodiazotropha sp.]
MPDELSMQQLAEDLKKAGSPWEMDPTTSMAQLSEDERRQRLGFTPPPGEMQFEEAVALNEAQKAQPPAIKAIAAPASYDLRNVGGKNYTTPVRNQGGCGSCVAFGVAAVLETRIKRGRNDPSLDVDLSEAHLFYCHAKEEGRNCSNGWWPDNALKKSKERGVTFEEHFQYTAGDQNCALQSGWQDDLALPTGHTRLGNTTDIKQWIATKGSVTGCFIVYQDFFSYRSGVYRHVSGDAAGGHCIEILGYNDAGGYWICKNSWGENWGENGYFRIAYGQCQIETWAGPFGVNSVSLRTWARNARVNGLWTNRNDLNAWVHFSGIGWRSVSRTNATVQHTMLTELIGAKAVNRRVDALEVDRQIQQVYVI